MASTDSNEFVINRSSQLLNVHSFVNKFVLVYRRALWSAADFLQTFTVISKKKQTTPFPVLSAYKKGDRGFIYHVLFNFTTP